jgi:hypothetical protein
MKRLRFGLFLILVLSAGAFAQVPLYPSQYTVATLPAASTLTNKTVQVTDSMDGGCTTGSNPVPSLTWCRSNGTSWFPVPDPRKGGSRFIDTDYASLSAAVTAIGSTVGELAITTASWPDGANTTVPATLRLVFRNAGTLNQTHTVTISGGVSAPPGAVFVGNGTIILNPTLTPIVYAAWWAERTVTVPGPTAAPTLSAQSNFGFGASFTNSTTYLVAYAYEVWNGKTGLSPTTSFTAKNSQNIGVTGFASLADNSKYAVGYYVYISPDAGATWHLADGLFTRPGLFSFGDATSVGGPVVAYNAAGATKPADGTTQTTNSGIVVSPPTVAPTVVGIHANAAATYYGAFRYLCGDGTFTALSPVSSGLVVATAGNAIGFFINNEPPSGAVAVELYVGTSATTSAMHLQATQPLNYVQGFIQNYDSTTAAPTAAGAAQSAICSLQSAYDAMMNSGLAGKIIDTGGPFKTPIILRIKNGSGNQVIGLQIEGVGGHAGVYTPPGGRRYYTGTQTSNVVGVMYATSALTWTGLDVRDPSARLSVGLASCDFFGGGGFNSNWHESTFEATKAGSVGYQIPIQATNSGSHTTSEQHFNGCNFSGDAWGIDVHGGQTTDIQIVDCETLSNGNSNSANSGQIRNATSALGLHIRGWEGTGAASIGYVFFLTLDDNLPLNSGNGSLAARDVAYDAVAGSATSFIHRSAVGNNTAQVSISDSVLASSFGDRYAFYSGGPTSLWIRNVGGAGNGWVNWVNKAPTESDRAAIEQDGSDNFFGLGATYGFKVSSNTTNSITDNADKTKVYINNVLLSRTGTNSNTAAQITGNQNEYNPSGLSYLQRWSSDASRNVTGLTFSWVQVDGEQHLILNVGAQNIVLINESASSGAASRFTTSTGADLTLAPNKAALVTYDGITSRWRATLLP